MTGKFARFRFLCAPLCCGWLLSGVAFFAFTSHASAQEMQEQWLGYSRRSPSFQADGWSPARPQESDAGPRRNGDDTWRRTRTNLRNDEGDSSVPAELSELETYRTQHRREKVVAASYEEAAPRRRPVRFYEDESPYAPVRHAAWQDARAATPDAEEVPHGRLTPTPDPAFSGRTSAAPSVGDVWREDGVNGRQVYNDGGDYFPASNGYSDGGNFGCGGGNCGGCGMCDGGCGDGWCGNRFSRTGYPCFAPSACCCTPCGRFWVRAEYLMWWTRGYDTPALVTTSPTGTTAANAGVLGMTGTSVLYGGEDLLSRMRSGGRIRFGTWLDCGKHYGLEGEYLGLGNITDHYSATSTGTPILARPFLNVLTGQEDSELVAFPGLLRGTVSVDAVGKLQGGGIRLRKNLVCESMTWNSCRNGCGSCGGCGDCDDCNCGCTGWHRLDLILGYRYLRTDESLAIREDLTSTATNDANTPVGTRFQILDRFATRNEFNGGEIGFVSEWRRCMWTYEFIGKCAIGSVHQVVGINGSTVTTSPNVTPVTETGGLLTQTSNVGTRSQNQFAVLPELDMTVGRYITPNLRGTFGYTFMYLSRAVRPGDQIDRGVNTDLIPPSQTTTGAQRPAFAWNVGDFWAQGLNFGLDYHW